MYAGNGTTMLRMLNQAATPASAIAGGIGGHVQRHGRGAVVSNQEEKNNKGRRRT
jgi:hypothetical protein